MGLGVDAEYHLGSWLHFTASVGWNAYVGDLEARRPDGSRLFEGGGNTLRASLGLGVQF